MTTRACPRLATASSTGAIGLFLLVGACGSAVFRPERPQFVTVPGAVATLASLKVLPDGSAWVTTSWQAGQGVALRSVLVAPRREAACGGDGLGRASVLRVAGTPRWERPISMTGVSILEAELVTPERALAVDSGLDFELTTPAGPTCVRLPFSDGAARAWAAVPTFALGATLQTDQMGITGFVRPGLWIGSYRHGVQIGVGDSRGLEGRRAILPFGRMLAVGWTTERLWSVDMGLFALSLVAGYQVRALIEPPPAGGPRIAHGPQVVVRPLTLVAVHPPQLPVGGRLGYLSALEFTIAYWLSGDGQERAGTVGVGITWDRPLTR